MSLSNFSPKASDQPSAQSPSDTHGTPLGSRRVSTLGSNPSQAMAYGRRV